MNGPGIPVDNRSEKDPVNKVKSGNPYIFRIPPGLPEIIVNQFGRKQQKQDQEKPVGAVHPFPEGREDDKQGGQAKTGDGQEMHCNTLIGQKLGVGKYRELLFDDQP